MTRIQRNRLRVASLALLVALLPVAGCGDDGETPDAVAQPTSPTGDGARFPAMARHADGRIAMTWTERDTDSVPVVRLAIRSTRGEWSAPSTVVRDPTLFVNFADIPQVAWLAQDEVAVSWLQRSGAGKYDYGIRLARSRDGGRTWERNAPPHDSTESGEHGFVSLVPLPDSRLGMTFLNGHSHGTPGGGTQLVYTEFDARGAVARRTEVDSRACDCCQTSATATAQGVVAVFRDRTAEEIRDIAVIRQTNGAWSAATPVARDEWKIGGCPVNGPAIAANGEHAVVAWFTGARDTAKVQVAFSDDAGATYSTPVRIDGGTPAGHVDVLMDADGSAIVSWIERVDSTQLAVHLRRVSSAGDTTPALTLGLTNGIRPTGWPAIVPTDDGVLVAWTVPGNPTRIRLQQVNVERLH